MAPASQPLLSVMDLRVEIPSARGMVVPSDNVTYEVGRGEIVGLVGESGSGKTLTALATIGLLPRAARIAAGSVRLGGEELVGADERLMRGVRGGRIGYIAQDASTALDPVFRVGTQIEETLKTHLGVDAAAARRRAVELLGLVGIPSPEERLRAYPHQLSGGMRQRVAIAIALSCEPSMVIADEPTTALDVTVQAQIIDLIVAASRSREMAVLLISHDMGMIAGSTDRTMVMYGGRLIEAGATKDVMYGPRHPYTEALLAATPRLDIDRLARFPTLPGRPPDLASPPPGCRFAPRCRYAQPRCTAEEPLLKDLPVACWFPREGDGEREVLQEAGID